MYDRWTVRFTSRDPLPAPGEPIVLSDNNWFGDSLTAMRSQFGDGGNVFAANRYRYARNNPIALIDPSGQQAAQLAEKSITGKLRGKGWKNFTARKFLWEYFCTVLLRHELAEAEKAFDDCLDAARCIRNDKERAAHIANCVNIHYLSLAAAATNYTACALLGLTPFAPTGEGLGPGPL
jgi:hypothetical protein